jgi:uncharacterized membrane protein
VSNEDKQTTTPRQAPSTRVSWRHGRLLPTNRLEAFSDGVFAIAITLLVLELRVPAAKEGLVSELGSEWPAYLGYFVSFAFIGSTWIAHSNLTRLIKAADAALMRLNLLFLLFVSILPFTTNLMASHLDGTDNHVVVLIFGANLTLAALMINVLIGHAARTGGIADDQLADEDLREFAKERRVALIAMAVATFAGLLFPKAAVAAFLVISVVFLVEPLWRASWKRRSKRADRK